jgi:hypothetical protein
MAEVFYSGEQIGRVTVRQGETKRIARRRPPKRRSRTSAAPSFQSSRCFDFS